MRNHMFFVKIEMEVNMRITTKHTVYTVEEKNQIIQEYLNGETGRANIQRKYDISSDSVFHKWLKQYRELGSVTDNRGRSSKKGISGRPKKLKPEEMSHMELIEYVKATEDIKKLMAFLKKQKKNIK